MCDYIPIALCVQGLQRYSRNQIQVIMYLMTFNNNALLLHDTLHNLPLHRSPANTIGFVKRENKTNFR